METGILVRVGYALVSLFVITNYGLLLIGSMARISAKVQGRVGQPVWQPYIDIVKSTAKRNSIGHGIMFYLGPVFRLAGGVGTYMFIPAVYGSVLFRNFSDSGDLLLVMYFIFFGQLGMAQGVEPLIAALSDKDPDVRRQVVAALSRLKADLEIEI